MKMKTNIITSFFITAGLLLQMINASAQNTELKYSIMMNGSSMGFMKVQKMCTTDKTQLSLESKAKKRFIISFEIYETHTEVFQNNVMTAASVLRQVNGKTKINKQMNFTGANCVIASEGKANSISVKPVLWSVLNLYFTEPTKISEVFSDSFQQMLKIEEYGDHVYKIALPDGNSNYFYYSNGICTKEIVNHSLYTVELILTK
jgi:hypothetical protein